MENTQLVLLHQDKKVHERQLLKNVKKKKKKNFHQTENDTFKWESSAKTTAKCSSTAPFSIISNPALPIMKAKWEYLEGMKNFVEPLTDNYAKFYLSCEKKDTENPQHLI